METLRIKILNIKEEIKNHYWSNTWSEPYAFYVGRGIQTNVKCKDKDGNPITIKVNCEKSPLANPFKVNRESERNVKIEQYQQWLGDRLSDPMGEESEYLDRAVSSLLKHRELNLACWCSPKKCHAEVVASFIGERVQEYYKLEGATTPPELVVEYIPSPKASKSRSRTISLAHTADSLENLRLDCEACEKCDLYRNRINSVWSRGEGKRRLMIVGEAPGQNENELGLPFIGDSGKMLEVMLASVGLDSQSDTWIVNAVKCRPPENRDPTAKEVDSCLSYLQSQISVLRPKVILALGKISTRRLVGLGDFRISNHRGKVYPVDLAPWKLEDTPENSQLIDYLKTVKVVPTYHPAYLLRNPELDINGIKHQAWQDLILVKNLLDSD